MKLIWALVLVYLISQLKNISCSVIFIVQRKIRTCPEVENSGHLDLSELYFVPVDDEMTAINGTLYIRKKIISPWEVIISSERYKYNNWEPGEIHRRVPDFCTAIKNPLDIVYVTTKNFKNKRCPLLAGTEELYNMETLSQYQNIVPVTFVGKWRFTVSYIYNKEPLEQDCFQAYMEIIEG